MMKLEVQVPGARPSDSEVQVSSYGSWLTDHPSPLEPPGYETHDPLVDGAMRECTRVRPPGQAGSDRRDAADSTRPKMAVVFFFFGK